MGSVPPEGCCRKCGETKPSSDFHKDKSRKDGIRPYCKACMKRYYEANAEKQRASAREWNRAHPNRVRAYVEAYRQRNPEAYKRWPKSKETQRAYKRSDKGRAVERAYYQRSRARGIVRPRNKPESITRMLQNHRRRANLAQSKGHYTARQWKALCDCFGHQCLVCGSSNITVDHVVPLDKQGSNSIDNLQPLCKPCNSSKGTKTTDYRDPVKLALFLSGLSSL